MFRLFVGMAVLMGAPGLARSQTGAYEFAVRMNSSGGLYHDPGFSGPEVVYRSSGMATPAAAHSAWQRSRGHARLVNAGLITDVQCVGNVCVGRGAGTQSTVARSRTVSRSGRRFVGRLLGRLRSVGAVRSRRLCRR